MSLIADVTEFPESEREQAMRALDETQSGFLDRLQDDVEVALFESPDRTTLERTHSRYFKSLSELGSALAKPRA